MSKRSRVPEHSNDDEPTSSKLKIAIANERIIPSIDRLSMLVRELFNIVASFLDAKTKISCVAVLNKAIRQYHNVFDLCRNDKLQLDEKIYHNFPIYEQS